MTDTSLSDEDTIQKVILRINAESLGTATEMAEKIITEKFPDLHVEYVY